MDLSDKEDNGTKRRGRPHKAEGPSSSDRPQKRAKKSEQEGPRPGSKRKRSHDDEPDSDNDDNEAEEGAQQNAADLAVQGNDDRCFCSAPVYQRFWFCKRHKNLQGVMRYKATNSGSLEGYHETMKNRNSAVHAVRWFEQRCIGMHSLRRRAPLHGAKSSTDVQR